MVDPDEYGVEHLNVFAKKIKRPLQILRSNSYANPGNDKEIKGSLFGCK